MTTMGAVAWLQAHQVVEAPSAPRRRSLRSWLLLLTIVMLAGGGFVEAHRVADGRLPLNTTVAGVDIGGLTPAAAESLISARLEPSLHVPVRVTHGDSAFTIVPADAGVRLDAAATVVAARAVTASWVPTQLVRYFGGGASVRPAVTIEPTAFHRAMQSLTSQIGKPAVEGSLAFDGGVAKAVYGQPGLSVDDSVAKQLLSDLAFSHRTAELPFSQRAQSVTTATVDEALRSFGQPAMAAPVTVTVAGNQIVLPPAAFGPAITMIAANGSLTAAVDPARLDAAVRAALPGTGPQVRNAGVTIVGTTPVITPALAGVSYDSAALAAAFTQILTTANAPRAVDAHATLTQPSVTTAMAQSWAIAAPVGTATFPADPALGARLSGFIVLPGQAVVVSSVLGVQDQAIAAGLAAAAQSVGLPVVSQGNDVTISAPLHGVLIQVTPLGSKEVTVTLWSSH